MHEIALGSVSASAEELAKLLGEPALPAGRYAIVGLHDERDGSIRSGALVQNVGDDLWSVYLLNEVRLQRVVASELTRVRENVRAGENGLTLDGSGGGGTAALELAGHAAASTGLLAGALPLLALTPVLHVLEGLADRPTEDGVDKKVLARQLAREGMQPSRGTRVSNAVRGAVMQSEAAAGTERNADSNDSRPGREAPSNGFELPARSSLPALSHVQPGEASRESPIASRHVFELGLEQ